MRPIIRVHQISKRFHINPADAPLVRYDTLRDSFGAIARAPLRWFGRGPARQDKAFWALKDVSFDVMPGEVFGIIGPNGAGKSTLLKILSRILEPTSGRAEIYGRIASLLEVGTGFHPDLTGRENVYLNGAVLGMRRREIEARFDEIVEFAEVGKFLETPVKHYSSGMYLRLAFAIAAHLDPEILIVDEVLAVGDASFQRKCLGKMDDVTRRGRTVLFVSHSLDMITKLCQRAALIQDGRVAFIGPSAETVKAYHAIWNPSLRKSDAGN